MSGRAVEGAVALGPRGRLEGWCWRPDRPGARLVAEILLDATPIGSIVAARFRPDLAERGIGDGRYGFDMRLRVDVAGHRGALTARCSETGQVFALIELGAGDAAPPAPLPPAVARLDSQMRESLRGVARLAPPADNAASRLATAFGLLGDRLVAHGAAARAPSPLAVAAEMMRRRFARVALPVQAQPRHSLIVPAAGDVAVTMAALAELAPRVPEWGAEIVLADDGTDPLTALLPTRVSGLSVVHVRGHALASAATQARGARLVFLDPVDARGLSIPKLAAWLRRSAGHPIVAGDAVLRRAGRVGALDALAAVPLPGDGGSGVLLAIDRATAATLHGVDPACGEDAPLAALDLCLRARAAGMTVVAIVQPPGGLPPSVPDRDLAAEAAFARRWTWAGHAAVAASE